jgi:hypothetical protein
MTLALGCLLCGASFAQVTGGAAAQASGEDAQPQPAGQLITGGVLRKAPVDNQQVPQAPPAAPQVQIQQQNPKVQQMPQQPLNAPSERKGRNQKDDKSLFGGWL